MSRADERPKREDLPRAVLDSQFTMERMMVEITIPERRALADGSGAFPLALGPRDGKSITAQQLEQVVQARAHEFRALAMKHGAVLLRGFDVNGPEDFAAISRALNCDDYSYIGGAAPRTELVPGLVFTSNESPPEEPIPFHHEMAQAPTPPNYILFFCEVESPQGGATPIIPSAEVADFFRSRYPDFARRVSEHGIRYIRVMPEVTDETSAQGRSWRETYDVKTREEAEAAMKRQGTTCEWLPNGDCRTITMALPGLRKDDRTSKEVFFNSVVAAYTGWNDARNVGKKAVVLGDGSPIDEEAIDSVAEFMRDKRVAFKWKRGDVLIIDNTLVMHSRETFVRPRRVLASLRGPPLPPKAQL